VSRDKDVKTLYETFPYPPPITDLTPFFEGREAPVWNPRDSFHVFFPEEPFRDDLDVLIAGCGTTAAVMLAATSPNCRFTAVDISESSIRQSRETAENHGLKNLEHHLLPLEEVATLGKDFDFIHCHGVLHHLADPVAGLRALGGVLRKEGSMSLMVYAPHGRQGIYMLQDFCTRVGLPLNETTATKLQELLQGLPENHPFYLSGHARDKAIALPEVIDMLMHPRDVAYGVDGVLELITAADMKFHRWLGQGQYGLEGSALSRLAVGIDVAALDPAGKAAAMELFIGTLKKHSFVVTHPERESARELFSGDGILDARVAQAAHVGYEEQGDSLILFSRAHDALHREVLAMSVDPARVPALVREFDDGRTVREVVEEAVEEYADPQIAGWILSTCRSLYSADILDFRLESSR
jgi:SAM-dependent methyltransferase